MTTTSNLTSFLEIHKKKENNIITHTRIGSKENNIYGGAYSIGEEFEGKFYDFVFKEIIQGNKMEYLTEKQHEGGIIYVDLDLKYMHECVTRQHDHAWVEELLGIYLDNLKKLMNITDKPFKIFVLQKDNVNRLTDGSLTKDGIHIMFGINCPNTLQLKLREMVIKDAAALMERLPLINTLDSVFDIGLSKGTTNAQLYGCRKPEHDAYKLVDAYNAVIDPVDGEFCMNSYPIELTKDTFLELCVRNIHGRVDFELTQLSRSILNPELVESVDVDFKGCNTDISKLLAIIGSTRCAGECQTKWNAVGQAIKNETKDEGLNDFVEWTNNFGTENKKKEAINHYQKYIKYTAKTDKKRLTIASLHYWARLDNAAAYHKAFPITSKKEVISLEQTMIDNFKIIDPAIVSRTEYDKAKAFNTIYKGLHVCVDKQRREFYCFNKTSKLWEFDVGGTPIRNCLSGDFYDIFETYRRVKENEQEKYEPHCDAIEINKKYCKSISDVMNDLKKTNDKNNVLTEIGDLCKNVEFPSLLNKSEYIIPTNDGNVLDMRTLVLTERTINDNFSFICNAKMVTYNKEDVNFIKVDKYFDDLFCGNNDTKKCVIDIIKSVFIGRPLRYIYFCIGSGSNGKSLLFKILNKIFGGFMDIISDSVIIEQKGNKSALNTEIEKLDKCRLGYVTELKETDVLNEKVIKQISRSEI